MMVSHDAVVPTVLERATSKNPRILYAVGRLLARLEVLVHAATHRSVDRPSLACCSLARLEEPSSLPPGGYSLRSRGFSLHSEAPFSLSTEGLSARSAPTCFSLRSDVFLTALGRAASRTRLVGPLLNSSTRSSTRRLTQEILDLRILLQPLLQTLQIPRNRIQLLARLSGRGQIRRGRVRPGERGELYGRLRKVLSVSPYPLRSNPPTAP